MAVTLLGRIKLHDGSHVEPPFPDLSAYLPKQSDIPLSEQLRRPSAESLKLQAKRAVPKAVLAGEVEREDALKGASANGIAHSTFPWLTMFFEARLPCTAADK